MSNKTDAAYHGSTLRDELLRVTPFSEDGTLLRRAAERIAELEAGTEAAVRAERERIAEAIHVQRFAVRQGDTTIDSYYYGSIVAERIACPAEHRDGEYHGGVARRLTS